MPSWEVIYKATADFSSLMKAAAEAREALKQVADEARRAGDAEATAATKAAAANELDAKSIKARKSAMDEGIASAARYNREVHFGGRSTMEQHLQDLDRERQLTELLQRAKQRGFMTPQADYAWRQQEMQQMLLWNRARMLGYTTPEQYLQYLDRERHAFEAENQSWASRNQLMAEGTQIAAAHDSALTGSHQSASAIADRNKGLTSYVTNLNALPDTVTTKVRLDTAEGDIQLAAWQRKLASIPNTVTSSPHGTASPAHAAATSTAAAAESHAASTTVTEHTKTTGTAKAVSELEAVKHEAKAVSGTKAEVKTETRGYAATMARIAALRRETTSLGRQVVAGKLDSAGFMDSAHAIEAEVGKLKTEFRGLGVQPSELGKLQAQFAGVQALGASRIHGVSSTHTGAHSVADAWKAAGLTVDAVLAHMKDSSSQAAQGASSSWGSAVNRIKGFFAGFSTGSGTSIFKSLASAADVSATKMVSGLGMMGASIAAVIQLLPPLAAGLGAASAVLAALPSLAMAAGGGFVMLHSVLGPVMSALQAYMQLLNAQQSAQANPQQAAMQQAALQHQVADAYYAVAQASFQASQTQITDAHAVADAQYNLSQAIFQAKQSQVTSAHTIAEAQYAVQQANYQATQTQINDAHAVSDAQYNLSQASFQASMQQVQSAMSVASALHSYQDAQFAVTQAQYQLTMAWQQADFQLKQLELTVSGASLNLRGAQLQLEEAQQNYAQVMAQSTSTALDRAQAAYQIQVAEQNLKQVELTNTQNELKLADVRKYGAKQVFGVTQAQQALTDAQFASTQAQQQAAVAEKEAANAQVQSAHAVKEAVFGLQQALRAQAHDSVTSAHAQADAQFNLSQAYIQARESRITSAHAIADAQFSLTQSTVQQNHDQVASAHAVRDAQFQLKQAVSQAAIAAAAGGPMMVSAFEALKTALSQLSPAAATGVGYLESLWHWWNDNTSAQQAFFTQVDPALKNISTIIPGLNAMLDAMASSAGEVARGFVTWFIQLTHSSIWKVLTKENATIVYQLGMAALQVAKGFTAIAVAAAPFTTWLVKGIDNIATRFDHWATAQQQAGSQLRQWLTAAKPLLSDLGHLAAALVYSFEILAGATPKFNSKGVLVGIIPSKNEFANLAAFETIINTLANQVLPYLAIALSQLARPAMATALADLVGSLAKLIATVVSAPGFTQAFTGIVDLLAGLVTVLSAFARMPAVGNIVGAIVGAIFAAVTAEKIAKLAHLTTVLGRLRKLMSGDWKGAIGLGTSGASVAETAAKGMQGAGDTMLTASENMQKAADTMAGSSAASGAAGAEGAASGAASAGADAAVAVSLGTRLKTIFMSALGTLGLAAIIDQVVVQPLLKNLHAGLGKGQNWWDNPFGTTSKSGLNNWKQFYRDVQGFFVTDVRDPLRTFFGSTLPAYLSDNAFRRYWHDAGSFLDTYVGAPTQHFLTQLLPDWLGGAGHGWEGLFRDAGYFYQADLNGPVDRFFASDLPNWLSGGKNGWSGLWHEAGSIWHTDIWKPFSGFWGTDLPNWLSQGRGGWHGLWTDGASFWHTSIWSPFSGFFTSTLPHWFSAIGSSWSKLWSKGWSDFRSNILDPVGNWFTNTLPSSLEGAFKNSVNWVIRNVINRVIGFINDVTGVVGVKISPVKQLASGGEAGFRRMPGRGSVHGSGDLDSEPTMLTPGEWVIRKQARMAIDRQAPGFLDFLNNYDRVGRYASGGQIVNYANSFVGKVPYVWGGTSPRGWDCSGFTDYVYSHFGYSPPRTSQQQWNWVKRTKTPEVGGLVFMAGSDGTKSSPGHVGIITGPNSMVDAYGTGYGTRHDSIYGSSGAVSGFGIPPGAGSGFLSSIVGFGKSAVGAFEKVFGGLSGAVGSIAHSAESLLAKGAQKSFDWVWGHTVIPLMEHMGLWGGGAAQHAVPHILDAGLFNIKKFVDKKITSFEQTTAAAGSSGGPASASASQAQNYARGQLSHYGWGAGQMPPLISLWNRESGWNRFARNPTSGAYGIPQALPYTKMPKAAWPSSAGGSSSAGAQINWGLSYIKGRYGDPSAAWGHEVSAGWYAGGGSVDPNRRHKQVEWWAPVIWPEDKPSPGLASGGSVGWAWAPGGKTLQQLLSSAQLARIASSGPHQYLGDKSLLGDGVLPKGTRYWMPGHLGGSGSGGSGSGGSGGAGSGALGNLNPAQQYALAMSMLSSAVSGSDTALSALTSASPSISSTADQTSFSNAQSDLANLGSALDTAYGMVTGAAASTLPAADWTSLAAAASALASAEAGGSDASILRKYAAGQLTAAAGAAGGIGSDITVAQAAWQALYGSHLAYPATPGMPGPAPGGQQVGPIDLSGLLPGGPAQAYYAGGGQVRYNPAMREVVARMFSGGMFGSSISTAWGPGAAMVDPMGGRGWGNAAGGFGRHTMPPERQVSEAGQAAGGNSFHVENLTVNNPLPERAGESLTHSVNRLAFLAGRGRL